jgi:hypothetical protein
MKAKKDPVLVLEIDEDGKVVKAKKKKNGQELIDGDYAPDEKRRIDPDGQLVTTNWCCWKQENGYWVCRAC